MKFLCMVPAMMVALLTLAACDAPQNGGAPPADAPLDTTPIQ